MLRINPKRFTSDKTMIDGFIHLVFLLIIELTI